MPPIEPPAITPSGAGDPPPGPPWDSALSDAPLVFVDLEMTGIDAASDRICEVAAVRVRGGEVEGQLDSLVDPGISVGGSVRVHGIGDAQLAGKAPLSAHADALARLLEGAVLVGHAVGFDLAFLRAAAARGELAEPPRHALDTRALAQRVSSGAAVGLRALAAELGLPAPTHRAMADVVTTRALFGWVARELRAGTPRHLYDAQDVAGPARVRADIAAVLREAARAGRAIRLCYRVPGRAPLVEEVDLLALELPHAEVHLRGRGERRRLRGDRILWAELV